MKARLLVSLSETELSDYRNSSLYTNYVLSSYLFTDTSLAFYCEYYGSAYKNNSIIIYNNGAPVLILYAYSHAGSFTHFNTPVSIVEIDFNDASEKQLAYKTLITKLNELLKLNDYTSLYFFENPFLLKEFFSKTTESQIEYNTYVDLALSEKEIKEGVRKSYKSLINWGEHNQQTFVIDHNNPDHDRFYSFKNFHIYTSKRQTRSDKTWDIQFEAIKRKEVYLVLSYFENRLVSGSLVMYGKKEAYYGVGVYDRQLMANNLPIAHYNLLYSIYHAKKIGLQKFYLGYLDKHNEDEKEKNIFKFKSGFTNLMKARNKFLVNLNG